VLTAAKCFATLALSLSAASDHAFALSALVIVSCVVNVLEQTMNNVSEGSRSRTVSAKSVPSTFERKRKFSDR